MVNILARASVSRFVEPVGGWLVRAGIGPEIITVVGTYIITLLGAGLTGLGVSFALDVALCCWPACRW